MVSQHILCIEEGAYGSLVNAINSGVDQVGEVSAIHGKLGIVSINGVITPHAEETFFGEPYGAACDAIQGHMRRLLADDEVGGILLSIDSPGGYVQGVPELGEFVYQSRGVKPIYAIANHMACSAACWIGAAAEKFYSTPSGITGSIGVIRTTFDYSKMMEDEGIKANIFRAGAYKQEGNPFEPLTEEAKQHFQEDVEETYSLFLLELGKYRRVSSSHVKENMGQGRTLNARQAAESGLIDGVTTLDGLVSSLLDTQKGHSSDMLRMRQDQRKRRA